MKAKLAFIVAVAFVVSGCAVSRVYKSETVLAPPLESAVLILPADVEVSLQNASGELEPRADWTEAATTGLYNALEEFFFTRGVKPIRYKGEKIADRDVDIIRQINVNLDAIELAQTKGVGGNRTYALSSDLVDNLDGYDADYAIFFMIRDSSPSGGRYAIAILAGLAAPGASAGITASRGAYRVALFDLRDGQVAWANFSTAAGAGIVNPHKLKPKQWQRMFKSVFSEFPL